MIEVKNLSKKYGNFVAVENVSFKVGKGEIVGLLGPNGAGKSTIMNIITGYLSLSDGSVTIDGFDITKEPEKAKRRIGYLPEIPPLYNEMKVKEYLAFVYDLKKVKYQKSAHLDEIMSVVKIDDVKNRLIRNLSKGYRQRVGFAAALVGNPDVIILDEPTVGLDPKQIIEIRSLIEKLSHNHTIILSSHILSEIQAVCENVIIINKGKLIANDRIEDLSKRIATDGTVSVTIKGDCAGFEKALDDSGLVKSYTAKNKKDDTKEYAITPSNYATPNEEIFDIAVNTNVKILDMHSKSISLEQVFLMLTENADNTEAIEMLKDKEKEEKENESDI